MVSCPCRQVGTENPSTPEVYKWGTEEPHPSAAAKSSLLEEHQFRKQYSYISGVIFLTLIIDCSQQKAVSRLLDPQCLRVLDVFLFKVSD